MKISIQMIFFVIVIVSIVGIGSLVSLKMSEDSLTNLQVHESEVLASNLIKEVDKAIYNRIMDSSIIAYDPEITELLESSNTSFGNLENRDEEIEKKDEEWILAENDQLPDFGEKILQNKISTSFRDKIEFFNEKTGYVLLGEIFVTNSYGVNVAQSGKTSDYKQNDEAWWQIAKQYGTHVSDVELDESADIYSSSISLKIEDRDGSNLGIIKTVWNFDEIISLIDFAHGQLKEDKAEIILLDENDEVIYSTTNHNKGDNLSEITSNWNILEPFGHQFHSFGNEKHLVVYSKSQGHQDYFGKNWKLIIIYPENVILGPVNEFSQIIMLITILTLSGSVVAGIVLSRSITRPIISLKKVARSIASGNFDAPVPISGKNEIGELGEQFDLMKRKLKSANMDLNEKLQQRAKQLADFKLALDKHSLVSITDKRGNIIYVNDKFCETSKYAAEQLIGKNHRILKSNFHPPEFYQGIWNVIAAGGVWKGDIKNQAKDGSFYWVRSIIAPQFDIYGNIESYIAIRTDITEHKETQERLGIALEGMKKVEKEKEEFTAMISHELKTPITPIMMWADALREPGILGELNDEQKDAVEKIVSSSEQLKELVSDMFDAYKLDLNKLTFTYDDIKVEKLLSDVCEIHKPIASNKGIIIKNSAKGDISIKSDRRRINQVLKNLIVNAIDFVPPQKGKIEINFIEEDDYIKFFVQDNGIGISKENQVNLFKKFYQTDTSYTREHGGSGLGLSISKGIVEGLGGKIWVESHEGKGTTFYFTIPKAGKAQNELQNINYTHNVNK